MLVCTLILSPVTVVQCSRVDRIKQVQTQAKLQYLVSRIAEFRASKGYLPTSSEFESSLETNDALRDAWGRRIRYHTCGDRYVLVSSGSDGLFELEQFDGYFDFDTKQVQHEYPLDIVVVDDEFVHSAGK